MKTSYFTAVLTLACLCGLGVSARAQDTEGVRVNVPFEFVAGGATLPAGTYTVGRVSLEPYSGIAISGYRHSALVLPIAIDGARTDQPKLSYEYVGDKHFLREVDTPGGIYTFALPRAMVALAQATDQGTVSSSGTN
jgi:hypothetical protein